MRRDERVTDDMVLAHAKEDAIFAGTEFGALGRADRTRYLERSRRCLSAALSIEQTQPVAWIVREITPSNGRGPNTIITGSVVPRGYEAITPLYAHPPTTRIADSAEAGGSATLSTGTPKTWGEWEREQQKPDGDR